MRVVIAALCALGAFAVAPASASAQNQPAGSRVYKLHAQNGSHEYGTVALKPDGASTNVEVHVINAPAGVMQPAHIHLGTCMQLDPAPKYPLTSVLDGTSDSVVHASMSSLLATPMAVNVHKSTSDLKDYVACVDLKPYPKQP